MIAAIEINELWIAIPAFVAGVGLLMYALWPATTARLVAFLGGVLLLFAGAICYVAADPASIPSPRPRPSPSNPDPVVITPVTPVPGGLAELVPAEVRGKVGRYYLSLATVLDRATNLKTTEELRNAYVSACLLMKDACQLPVGLAGFRAATDAMLKAAVGLESQQLTPDLRTKFTATCRQIAAELGVTQ